MPAVILHAQPVVEQLEAAMAARVESLVAAAGHRPTLAVLLVGDDPASQVYVRNKVKACERIGMESRLLRLPASTTQDALIGTIETHNRDPNVDGLLVQLPLPAPIDPITVLDHISPEKDVDGFHPHNLGLLLQGRPRFVPCTPRGVLELLRFYQLDFSGKRAVVLGRSEIVGKPMAAALVQRTPVVAGGTANATVTCCHSRTPDLAAFTRQADLLVVAVGRPRLVTPDMVAPHATVVDVGIHRVDGKLVGDVDFDPVSRACQHITPVPGGVGRMTVAMLLENTLAAAEARRARNGT